MITPVMKNVKHSVKKEPQCGVQPTEVRW